MIDEEITFREKGYYISDLSYGSNNEVWAVCEGEDCQRERGRGRWVEFRQYRKLCHSCAIKKRDMVDENDIVDKLPWVDDEITFAEKGYYSTELSHGSGKIVWAVCSECGLGRWVMFKACSDLCRLCASNKFNMLKDGEKTEKRECIDDEITFADKGYRSTDLKPGSKKDVWRVCAGCGEGTWVIFHQCRDLCPKCVYRTDERSKNISKNHADFSRENNPNWKGGITPESIKFRMSDDYVVWRTSVFERDDYTCQECGDVGGVLLNAHHILPYRDYKDTDYSLNVDNGITLCEDCHYDVRGREYEFVERYQGIVNNKKL